MHDGSGLNFQQGHFTDPLASMQASLGAGSMFAKTLSNMQQFDQDEAKLQMMRQDQAQKQMLFQQGQDDRAAAQKEISENNALETALTTNVARANIGNYMMDKAVKDGTDKYFLNADDSNSEFKNLNHNVALKDQLAGIDRTKLNSAGQAEYDSLLGASDAKLNVSAKEGAPTYEAATKYDLFKRAHSLKGLGENEAGLAAAKALGISVDGASGIDKSELEQNAFVNKYETAAATDPLFGMTKLDKIKAFQESGHKLTAAGLAKLDAYQSANAKAIADQHEALNKLYQDRAAKAEGYDEKNMSTAIQLGEQRMRLLTGENSSEDKIARALTSVTGGDKLSNEEKYAVQSARMIGTYGIQSKPEVSQNIAKAYEEAYKKGYSASEATALITKGLKLDGAPEEREKQAYKFDSQAMFKQAPKPVKGGIDSTDYATIRQEQIANNDAAKKAEMDKIENLFLQKQKAGSGSLAAMDKQIYDLKRTPDQAFRDGSYGLMTQLETDHNLGGFGNKAYEKELQDRINNANSGVGNTGTGETSAGGKTGDVSKKSTGNSLYDKTSMILSEKENKNPYNLYEDHYEKDGKVRPAIGKGFLIADVNKEFAKNGLPTIDTLKAGWGSYKLSDSQKKIVDSFEHNFISGKIDAAQKALPLLDPKNSGYNDIVAATASGFHQYGSGSKVLNPVIEEVQNLVSQGKYQDAINFVGNSPYGRAYKERAVDLMHGIESYAKAGGYKGKLTADAKFDFKDQASFIKFYNDVDKWTKTQNMNATDREKTLHGLRDRAAEAKYNVKFNGYDNPSLQKTLSNDISSPNDNMINLLHSGKIDVSPSIDSLISKGYMDQSGKSVVQVRDEASKSANDFDYYKNMHKNQYEIRQKQLEADGKSDIQISVIKDAGLSNAYKNAKSAKERLQIHAEALQKIAEHDGLQRSLLGF